MKQGFCGFPIPGAEYKPTSGTPPELLQAIRANADTIFTVSRVGFDSGFKVEVSYDLIDDFERGGVSLSGDMFYNFFDAVPPSAGANGQLDAAPAARFPDLERMMREPATPVEALILTMLTVVTTHPAYSGETWEEAYAKMIEGAGTYTLAGHAEPLDDAATSYVPSGFDGKRMKLVGFTPCGKAYLECRLLCRAHEIPHRDSIRIGLAKIAHDYGDAFEKVEATA